MLQSFGHLLLIFSEFSGTNGAVSGIGLLVSLFGGFLIGLVFLLMTILCLPGYALRYSPPQYPYVLVGSLCGLLGSVIDSYLGALFQYSGAELIIFSHFWHTSRIHFIFWCLPLFTTCSVPGYLPSSVFRLLLDCFLFLSCTFCWFVLHFVICWVFSSNFF